jgi:hypothetical protein
MPTRADDPLKWAILPDAALDARLMPKSPRGKPTVEILGNRSGVLSLGNLLLWASSDPSWHESLSITELSFARVESALRLRVIQEMENKADPGYVRRTDANVQFEWVLNEDSLRLAALGIINVAFTPEAYTPLYFEPPLSDDSDAQLRFAQK